MKRTCGKIHAGLILLAVILITPLLPLAPTAMAVEYTFARIYVPGGTDVPGAIAYGINDSGNIVGCYLEAISGLPGHGFLLDAEGGFTKIDFPGPGAWRTWALGINDSGDIIGGYTDTTGNHSFLYEGGVFSTISVPSLTNNIVWGINNFGDIVGSYDTARGFLYKSGVFTTIDFPGIGYTIAYGINNSGDIVGHCTNGGFLYAGGNFTLINVPGATALPGTVATGINDFGNIVGYYITDVWHGFLYVNGSFTTIDYPGSTETRLYGVNNSGYIVGEYKDANGWSYGFLATPVPEPIAIDINPASINLKKTSQISVAILSKADFDAPGQIDRNSLTFGRTGSEDSLAYCNSKPRDVDRDGFKDLLCYFYTNHTGFQCGDNLGTLNGHTVEGFPIRGSDSVRILQCK